LSGLFLAHNQINDIHVLVGIETLRTVNLVDNPLDDTVASIIEKLIGKGVTVTY